MGRLDRSFWLRKVVAKLHRLHKMQLFEAGEPQLCILGGITQVEDEDLLETNTIEARAKKTRTLEEEDEEKTAKAKLL